MSIITPIKQTYIEATTYITSMIGNGGTGSTPPVSNAYLLADGTYYLLADNTEMLLA